MDVRSYRDLSAWQKAMALTVAIYRVTEQFPQSEEFGLSRQLRRAATSIPSNIAEGQGRSSTNDYIHFLHIVRGSLQEMETQLLLAQQLNFLSVQESESVLTQSSEVSRLISGLISSLKNRSRD